MKFKIKHRFSGAVLFECDLPAEIRQQSSHAQLGYAHRWENGMATKTDNGLTVDELSIKVGDRVKCIDAGHSFHRLAEGAFYTVEAAYDGSPTVIVNGAYHSIERFELVDRER